MARSLALLALFSATAMAAQSTTVSLLLPYGGSHVVGSIVGADSTATTYAFGCAPGKPAGDCGFETTGSQTVTQGPTTWLYTSLSTGDEGIVTQVIGCKLSSAVDIASCSGFIAAKITATTIISTPSRFTSSVYSSTTVGTQPFLEFQDPVTITAGLEKLKATPGASATDDSTAAPTNTGTPTTSSGAASTTLARQTTAASTASTTAAPSSTNAAGFVNAQNGLLAGVAALVGGVMML